MDVLSVASFHSDSHFIPSRREVGKVVGGTRGNPVLEYISGAPNKAMVIEDEPNIFDYDQLTKYGFDVSESYLVVVCLDLCHVDFGLALTHHSLRNIHLVSRDSNHECRWASRNV